MKDLSSFFLLKNAFGAKMKKGFRNSCSGDDSTSTSTCTAANNQLQRVEQDSACIGGNARSVAASSPYLQYPVPAVTVNERETQNPTLEEMILQLEAEEKAARRARLEEYGEIRHRMSCVNSSDILRSARNALNQYPRFSLDGKDAMYRSSFRNMVPVAMSNQGLIRKDTDLQVGRIRQLPSRVAGENVVWCRPGVVGKLMGLEAIPIPVGRCRRRDCKVSDAMKKRQYPNQRWREDMSERDEIEKTSFAADTNDWVGKDKGVLRGSCSTTGYCFTKPVRVESRPDGGWPMRRFQ